MSKRKAAEEPLPSRKKSKKAKKADTEESKAPGKKWRWGFIGSGKICQDFARALSALPEAEIIAVAARSKVTAESFAKTYNVPHVYDSYEALAKVNSLDLSRYVRLTVPLRF